MDRDDKIGGDSSFGSITGLLVLSVDEFELRVNRAKKEKGIAKLTTNSKTLYYCYLYIVCIELQSYIIR